MPIHLAGVSPLRYPGSKAFLVNYIDSLLTENHLDGCHFIEPYAGSAIISIELLKKGAIADSVLIEKDPLIYCFWKSVFEYTYEFIEKIFALPITLETWNAFQIYRSRDYDKKEIASKQQVLKLGLAGLFFNRTSFSGIMNAGPLGGKEQESKYKINCRFNKERIIRIIVEISNLSSGIDLIYGDALSYLKRGLKSLIAEQCFIYADPPYFGKGKQLYRYWYEKKDHQKLARYLLSSETPWLVSYDDRPEIINMYSGAPGKWKTYIDYSVSTPSRRTELELLISNLPIPPKSHELLLIQVS